VSKLESHPLHCKAAQPWTCSHTCLQSSSSRERTIIGSVSYWIRYLVYRIESYRLLLYRPILCASLPFEQPLTGRITQQIKGHLRPPSAARGRAIWSTLRKRVGGAGKGRLTDCNLIPASPLNQDRTVLGPGHQAGSDNNTLNCQSC